MLNKSITDMVPKIGSIGKGLVSLGRRKSWKAAETYKSAHEDDKDDLFDPLGEDYLDTYHTLLSGVPSWSLAAVGVKTSTATESSTEDESILSDALFDDDKVKELADRIKHFSGRKELDQMLYPGAGEIAIKLRRDGLDNSTSPRHSRRQRSGSMLDTSTTSRHSQRQRSGSMLDISASSRQSQQQFLDKEPDVCLVSHPQRDQVVAKSKDFHSRSSAGAALRGQSRSSWAERKNTSPEFSRANPPPPPPRRHCTKFPPPPPPPPAPLSTEHRRSSTVESIQLVSSKLSTSCAEFSRHKSTIVDMLTKSEEQPMKLEPSIRRPRQLSLSCSDADQKYSEQRGQRRDPRPRKLSMSCSDANISYVRPVRPRSIRRVSFEDQIRKHLRKSYSDINDSDPPN